MLDLHANLVKISGKRDRVENIWVLIIFKKFNLTYFKSVNSIRKTNQYLLIRIDIYTNWYYY